ncbi:NusA N-terminal domain-containing protein, partial [Ochromonadaceae sp. CCMP2298]
MMEEEELMDGKYHLEVSSPGVDHPIKLHRQGKNIDRPTMIRILEDVFRTMIRKKFETDDNFDIIINADNGDLEIWRFREIVDDNSEDIWDHDKIAFADAIKIEPDFEIGEEVAEEIKLEDFGRRAVMTARQTLIQKIKDLEKDILFQKYKDLVGEIIQGEVYQVLSREVLLIDGEGNELTIPKGEQIPKDRFRKGDSIRAIVHRAEMVNGNPKVILSRTSPVFLERLFEAEVPEVYDGLITMKNVVREPDNLELYLARALSPAKIVSMKISEEKDRVSVYLKPDQVSLAIGKGGQNIKLASKLVGMEIDVFRELDESSEEDVDLEEFTDELEDWVIDELKRVGLDTARSVLKLSTDDLEKGFTVDANPNSKINQEQYDMLARQFADSAHDKEEASELVIGGKTDDMIIKADKVLADEKADDDRVLIKDNAATPVKEPEKISARTKLDGPKVVGKIDLNKKKEAPAAAKVEEPKPEPVAVPEAAKAKVEEKKEAPVEKVEEKKEEPAAVTPKEEKKEVPAEKVEEKKPEPVAEKPKEEEKAPENQ